MREIRWLKEAEDELAAIVEYVMLTFGVNAASQVYEDIISRVDVLAEFPESGTVEKKYVFNGKPLWVLHSKLTRIFYSVSENEVIIVLLWSNRMNDRTIKKVLFARN